jgi:hypothetical protein
VCLRAAEHSRRRGATRCVSAPGPGRAGRCVSASQMARGPARTACAHGRAGATLFAARLLRLAPSHLRVTQAGFLLPQPLSRGRSEGPAVSSPPLPAPPRPPRAHGCWEGEGGWQDRVGTAGDSVATPRCLVACCSALLAILATAELQQPRTCSSLTHAAATHMQQPRTCKSLT